MAATQAGSPDARAQASPGAAARRFDPAALEGLPATVRRYFEHAIAPGATLADDVRIRMVGAINVGRWLDFEAEQEIGLSGFCWRARAGRGRLKPLSVVDEYRAGAGRIVGHLGPLRFLDEHGADTTRAAAVRAALERIWAPASLLPDRGVRWRAEGEDRAVATITVPPEQAEVHVAFAADGAVSSLVALRWGKRDGGFGYLPFGGIVSAERRFGDTVVPSAVTVGWEYGTPRFAPFFRATLIAAEPIR